jgi:hypothetical protein
VLPETQEIWAVDAVAKVTGHAYRLWFPRAGHIVVHDLNTQKELPGSDLEPGKSTEFIPGLSLKLEGQPQAGDSFLVKTTAPKALDYVVHDGMVLTPIASFISLALHEPRLASYQPAARRYLEIIEGRLVHKWDPMWVDLKDNGGVYTAPDDPAQRFAGCALPHNQYLALARTFLTLHRATRKPWYYYRAAQMGRFFKANLRLVDSHYEWNYWDPAIPRDVDGTKMRHPEDTSHGHIDVGFAVDAYEAGHVFTRNDTTRLARTLLHMWNGSPDSPSFGRIVGKKDGEFTAMVDWVRLGAFDAELRSILGEIVSDWNNQNAEHALAAAQWLACDAAGWGEGGK